MRVVPGGEMKRVCYVILAALMIMLILPSCEISLGEEDTVTVPLPVFGEKGTSEDNRGLLSMPTDYFEGDHWLSCAVMTIMPTMTNLQASEISVKGSNLKNVETNYTVFGFDVNLAAEYSHINSDGIYLSYEILYDDAIVGFCDYYYNIDEKKFSYRQSVCCSFTNVPDNEMLNMEYIDIPIENVMQPVFRTGQLTENGVLASDAYVDNVHLSTMEIPGKSKWIFTRAYITMNEVKGENGLYTMYAFKQPDNSFETSECDYSEGTELTEIIKNYAGDNLVIDTDEERKGADFSLLKKLYPIFYTNGQSISDHHSKTKGYSNYEEFKSDSFSGITDFVEEKKNGRPVDTPKPVIYTYNGKESYGASVQRTYIGDTPSLTSSHGSIFYWALTDENPEANKYKGDFYNKLGFNRYYGEYDSEGETITVYDFTVEKHLKACGIDDDEYIKAFIKAENYIRTNNSSEKYPERISR